MDPSINFTPKSFSKRLSRHSYISSISEVERSVSRLSIDENANKHSHADNSQTNPHPSQSTDTIVDDEVHYCLYCQESSPDCLVKCAGCSNYFCNSGIKDSSHIFIHSKFLHHDSFRLLNYQKNENYEAENQEYLAQKDSGADQILRKPTKFLDTAIECAHCSNQNIYELSFILINDTTKELVNLKTEYSQVDKLQNLDKKIIFFCSNSKPIIGTGIGVQSSVSEDLCFKNLQQKLFGGLDIEEDFIKPIVNNYDKSNKFGFKKFFFNRLILKDNSNSNSKLLYNQLNLSNIYTIETKRLQQLKKQKLKKNDFYNLIDENNDYQFFDSDDESDFEDEVDEKETRDTEKSRESETPSRNLFTSPLLNEENELFQNKTNGLKKITKSHLSKISTYESFAEFSAHHLNLMFKEQYAMLSLSSTSHKLSNNMVFVPYKKITFGDQCDVVIRLNTNYNLPILKIRQILGFQHPVSGRTSFGMIEQVPNNTFNPEIKLKLLKFKNHSNNKYVTEETFIENLEDCLRKLHNETNSKSTATSEGQGSASHLSFDKTVSDYKLFNIIPFDLVFSRIIDIIFQILSGEIRINNFLLNVILGKNFENFEFNLSSFRSNNFYNENFNLSQRRAIDNLDSNKVVLIKGEVGTGKTLVSSGIIKNLIEKNLGPVLVCSGANSSIDNLCERFYQDFVINKSNKDNNSDEEILISRLVAPLKEGQYNINHKIGGICFHNFILSNAPEELIDLFIKNKVGGLSSLSPKNTTRLNKFYQDFFQQQDAIFTTCYNAFDPKLNGVKFKSIVIDDCSATMNLLSLIPLAKNCEKLVLIGDDKQLSPYIHDLKMRGRRELDNEDNQTVHCNFLKQSLFQRILYNKLVKPIVLTEQYRMNNKLAEFPNNFFYNNELINGIINQARKSSIRNSSGANGRSAGLSRSMSLNSIGELSNRRSSIAGNQRQSMISANINKFPWPNMKAPMVFWDHTDCKSYKENEMKYHKKINNIENFYINQKTYQNQYEVKKIIEVIKRLHFDCGVELKDIGVVTIYPGQRVLITQMIQEEFAGYQDKSNKRNSKRSSMHRRSSSVSGNGNGNYNNNSNNNNNNKTHNRRKSYTNNNNNNSIDKNRNFSNQFQRLSAKSSDFLFETHNPNEYEMSEIDKVKNIEIGSVDSFQGKEKEYILFSTVKSELIEEDNLEELKVVDDYRRLNVGVTRARKGLIVLGNSIILSQTSRYWSNYLSYLYEQNCVVEGDEIANWQNNNYKTHLTYLVR
ncbi:hypothetical protein DASC09_038470 [Saccharomycopsis crataegensis]|uniref:Upf1 domain-containing protein n=1 Tax=Saccharomycopsis crataegensis TaxID=43959 RepID=A0AAV5QNY2_9ASCO|nr:hypothetical protein DASC09_038470 [Saccharomycopsis crataegensis]